MAALSITSVSFDKASYNPGDVITLTVIYASQDSAPAATAFKAQVTAADSQTSAEQTVPFTISGAQQMLPVTVTVTDSRPGTWTLLSDTVTGSGPWTGTAVLTSTA
jgi:protein-disulfide isomerase-like protein with CxxC motif